MKKQELLTRLQIAKGELQDHIYSDGCFDEIAQRIFMLAFSCEELLDESSDDIEIQLDKSVQIIHCGEQEYIDGIYLSGTITEVHFTASSFDGSELYAYDIENVERKYIIEVVKQLIKMCK